MKNGDHKELIVILTDFNDVSSHDGIPFNEESVREYLDSSEFKKRLKDGHLLGLLTHGGRTDRNQDIPDVDHVLKHKDFCNVIIDTWIEGSRWVAKVKLVDTEASNRLVEALAAGIECGVSIVVDVDSNMGDSYILRWLYGVDFTLEPSFSSARIISKNFSRKNRIRSLNVNCKQFSFVSYIREASRGPADLIKYRIREVVNILKDKNVNKESIEWAKDYIKEPILKWLRQAIRTPGRANITISLRLNRWVPSSILTLFNSEFNRIKSRYEQNDSISVSEQRRIRPVYNQMINSIYESIESDIGFSVFKNFSKQSSEYSPYLTRLITSLYEYLDNGDIEMSELEDRIKRIIERRKKEGIKYVNLFDDLELEEFVYYFMNAQDKEEKKQWFNNIRSYLKYLIKIDYIL